VPVPINIIVVLANILWVGLDTCRVVTGANSIVWDRVSICVDAIQVSLDGISISFYDTHIVGDITSVWVDCHLSGIDIVCVLCSGFFVDGDASLVFSNAHIHVTDGFLVCVQDISDIALVKADVQHVSINGIRVW